MVLCFGFSESTTIPFLEARYKRELCNVLWSSVEASGCNSQKTSRPSGRKPDRMQSEQLRRELRNYRGKFLNIRLRASVTSTCLVRQKTPWWQKFRWWRRRWNGDAEVAKTTVKRLLLCCGFRRTGTTLGQVYQCWRRICREINISFRDIRFSDFIHPPCY
jgi:hypothetical protein